MAHLFRLPELFTGLESARITSWDVAEGEQFSRGEPLATVETDKAAADLEAPSDGVLLRILAPAGTDAPVDAAIAVLGAVGEDGAAADALLAAAGHHGMSAPAAVAPAAVAPAADSRPAADPMPGARIFASPLVRRLAQEHQVPLSALSRSGPGRRLRRVDLERFLAQRTSATAPTRPDAGPSTGGVMPGAASSPSGPSAPPEYVETPASSLRRVVAARLVSSTAEAPHFFVRGSARMEALLALRAQLNDGESDRVSVNDLLLKAVAATHARHPEMNVTWSDGAIRQWQPINIGVAIATKRGLVTPVLRQVDRTSVMALSAQVRDLVERARAGQLRLEELEGGTISVTNLGMYGTEEFSAIINPPQSAILAVGAVRDEAVVQDGQVVAGKVARFTLSVDHRPLDGAVAAGWMRTFLGLVESPVKLLL